MDDVPMSGPERVDPTFEVPKGVACPRCHQVIDTAQNVTPGSIGFHKGLIVVCSSCSLISVVGDSNLIPLSLADVKKLPPDTQRALLMTVKSIARHAAERN